MDDRLWRKNTDTLAILGWGTILFGAWSIIKAIATYATNADLIKALIRQFTEQENIERTVMLAIIIIYIGILCADVIARFYVGASARAQARGKKKRNGYIIITYFLIALYVFEVAENIFQIFNPYERTESIINVIVNAFINFSSLVTLIELVVYAKRIKRTMMEVQHE